MKQAKEKFLQKLISIHLEADRHDRKIASTTEIKKWCDENGIVANDENRYRDWRIHGMKLNTTEGVPYRVQFVGIIDPEEKAYVYNLIMDGEWNEEIKKKVEDPNMLLFVGFIVKKGVANINLLG